MSEFMARKMKTFFHRLDFDKDGTMTQKDFEAVADRFIARRKLDDTKAELLKQRLVSVWAEHINPEYPIIGFDEAVVVASLMKCCSDPTFAELVKGISSIMFHVVDGNSDGVIDKEEFRLYFECCGFDTDMAENSFNAIDTDHDGEISHEEFVAACVEFFTDPDETKPGTLFFGTLA